MPFPASDKTFKDFAPDKVDMRRENMHENVCKSRVSR